MKNIASKINNVFVILFLVISFGAWFLLDYFFSFSDSSFTIVSVIILVTGILLKTVAVENKKVNS